MPKVDCECLLESVKNIFGKDQKLKSKNKGFDVILGIMV
jgi:hypothetical protein